MSIYTCGNCSRQIIPHKTHQIIRLDFSWSLCGLLQIQEWALGWNVGWPLSDVASLRQDSFQGYWRELVILFPKSEIQYPLGHPTAWSLLYTPSLVARVFTLAWPVGCLKSLSNAFLFLVKACQDRKTMNATSSPFSPPSSPSLTWSSSVIINKYLVQL